MRGKTAKRLRKLATFHLFAGHMKEAIRFPNTPEEAYTQHRRMQKILKKSWKLRSKPKSLRWVSDSQERTYDGRNWGANFENLKNSPQDYKHRLITSPA